ncbi:putative Atrial natriuretic peptide receptor 2 [Hypsibius exemplaris]|uniref:guanylate cyclase n=1 Tax=Hypsibius exemplaris TaxID=2072580 RepID=A0A1W0X741_HYPEX|nr:putative Atrial natriuretic peptide receptor 2 [Hypsibius exemplaris]
MACSSVSKASILIISYFCLTIYHDLIMAVPFEIQARPPLKNDSGIILNVCIVLEKDSFYVSSYSKVAAAVDLAVTNANRFILPRNTQLQTKYQSAGQSCTQITHDVVKNVLRLLRNGTTCDAFVGPGCATTAVGLYGIADKYNVPIFGCPAAGAGSLALNGDDSYSFFTLTSGNILKYFQTSNAQLFWNSKEMSFVGKDLTEKRREQLLGEAKNRSRVIILLTHARSVRQFLVFIAMELYSLDYWGRIKYNNGDANDDLDPVVMSFYEAIMLYAQEVAAMFRAGLDFRNGAKLTKRYLGTEYNDVSVSPLRIGTNEERDCDFDVKLFNRTSGKFELKEASHANLQRFIGIALTPQGICHLVKDIVFGMNFLHTSPILSHGNSSSLTCLIDMRFTLKISDFGLPFFRNPLDILPYQKSDKNSNNERWLARLLWRAPELLRQGQLPQGTQKGDVYSFSIILQQIILESDPFEIPADDQIGQDNEDILDERWHSNGSATRSSACLLIRALRSDGHMLGGRPRSSTDLSQDQINLKRILGKTGDNIVDVLLQRMEQYTVDLELKVDEKTQQFMEEKERSEQLLGQLLPNDIVGFTTIASGISAMEVVGLLNSLYTLFDSIMDKFDVYKVETIGDAYMVKL